MKNIPGIFSADPRDAALRRPSPDFHQTTSGGDSQLAQRGISLYKIATMMGNSSEICRRHYAALIPEAMGTEVEFSRIYLPLSTTGTAKPNH